MTFDLANSDKLLQTYVYHRAPSMEAVCGIRLFDTGLRNSVGSYDGVSYYVSRQVLEYASTGVGLHSREALDNE